MDDAKSLLSQLQSTDTVEEQEKYVTQMTSLISELNDDEDGDDSGEVQKAIVDSPALNILLSHLNGGCGEAGCREEGIRIASAKFIAEVAKTESVRESLVQKGFMTSLLTHLPSKNVGLATQVCRALGNICFDNDAGRLAVDEAGGIATILKVLSNQNHNTDEGSAQLRVILCGFLLNLTNSNEQLQSRAIEANVLDLLNDVVLTHIQDQDLTKMALLAIGSITEAAVSCDSSKPPVIKTGLLSTFKTLLDNKDNINLYSVLLYLLNGIMESESAKERAAEIGLCDSLISIINLTGQEDMSETVQMASDVLISILVGDNSMEIVYEDGKGQVFQQCLDWLNSDQETLQTLGCLAIGNFARRDSYCVELVDKGIVGKLLVLLKSTPEKSFYVQHAVLSTLRNLAIPVPNKPRLLEQGVMEACLILKTSEMLTVVFKLLGLLRMLIEGQESAAVKLGQDRGFLDCLCEWCSQSVHAGVEGEAPRVVASLIKNSRSLAVIQNLIRASCVGHLVSMATSEHMVMQNEAIMALTFVCSTALGDAAVALRESDLAGVVAKLLKDDRLPAEMLCNILSLTQALMSAEHLQEEIINSSVIDQVRALSQDHGDAKVKEAAGVTLTQLEKVLEGS